MKKDLQVIIGNTATYAVILIAVAVGVFTLESPDKDLQLALVMFLVLMAGLFIPLLALATKQGRYAFHVYRLGIEKEVEEIKREYEELMIAADDRKALVTIIETYHDYGQATLHARRAVIEFDTEYERRKKRYTAKVNELNSRYHDLGQYVQFESPPQHISI